MATRKGKAKGVKAKLDSRRRKGCTPAGVMNGTETRYAEILEARRLAGEIVKFEYEVETLILNNRLRCSLTPDFKVEMPDGSTEFHEVKGSYMRDDAWVKLKWAADKYRDRDIYLCMYKRSKKDGEYRWSIKLLEP